MQELPAFGEQLMRLAEIRGLGLGVLAHRASVPDAEITSVLDGAEPDPSLLYRLAPVLDLHRGDLLVIAGLQVPDELAPLDVTARDKIGWLSWSLAVLPRALPELHQLVRSLPQQPRPLGPLPPTPTRQRYPNCAGGLVLRLLHNRNLDWLGSAKFLYYLGGGPVLSASTIGMIGRGAKSLTPDLLAGFAACLDITPADLNTLTGIDLPPAGPPHHPDAAEAADLIWNARRLTTSQLRQVHDRAHAIRHERAEELDPRHRCSSPGH